jgi:hypothetical protein
MKPIPMPLFHEGLVKEPWYQAELERQKIMAAGNPFVQRYAKLGMKEGIFSDMSGALGKIHDTVIDAARPNLIGRQIIDVRNTIESLERFPLEKESVAYVAAEGGMVRYAGARYTFVDIQPTVIVKDGISWTKEFVEDAGWNVLERQLAALGRSVAKKETEKLIDMYEAIIATDLAGGAEIAGGAAVLTWDKLVELWDAVEGEDHEADVAFLHTKQMSQLFVEENFINNNYIPSAATDLSNGVVGRALTASLLKSSLCTNGQVHMVSKYPAAVMLVRRDFITEPWEDVQQGKIGIVASERIGYGVLKSKAVARGTNFKTTFV